MGRTLMHWKLGTGQPAAETVRKMKNSTHPSRRRTSMAESAGRSLVASVMHEEIKKGAATLSF
jgi:hypothetical protein